MEESNEQRINAIREKLIRVSVYIHEIQGEAGSPRYISNLKAAVILEDIIVEFERLVNELPVEARS